ncbi:MAG: hypothetical protein LBI79_08275 [Nitrososphaerota archaeon]|nr:hypothetical protein [Nitrososphaerota archaeon]
MSGVKIYSGVILGNTALRNGGGVWVDVGDLDKLYVFDGVVFSDNHASVAYTRNSTLMSCIIPI